MYVTQQRPDMKLCKCGAIVDRKCDRCYPVRHEQSTAQRGYDNTWRRLSESVRREQPLCPDCEAEDMVMPSTEVHHIVSIVMAPQLRLVRENLVALCRRHHEEREK